MKKILIIAALVAGLMVSAQVKIGDNVTSITSINANSILELESTTKGVLFPRVALTGTANVAPLAAHVQGMTVYNTATAGDVTPGIYTNSGAAWVRLDNVSASTLYTADGTLTGARTVTQNNNDLTFTTGTGKTIINGTFKTSGGVYANVRTVTTLPIVWSDSDYMVIVKVSNNQNIILPDPTQYPGRVIFIRNGSVSAGTSGTYTYITYVPQDVSSILANRGQTLVSDGTKWFTISGV